MSAGGVGPVQPECALHVLERLLHVMTYTPFIDLLVALLCPSPSSILDNGRQATADDRAASGSLASTSQPDGAARSPVRSTGGQESGRNTHSHSVDGHGRNSSSPSPDRGRPVGQKQPGKGRATAGQRPQGNSLQPSAFQALFALHEHSAAYRECFLAVLSGQDPQLACAAVRTLVAVLQSKAVSSEVLDAAGMLQWC